MPKFEVIGADKENGVDRKEIVQADNKREAEAIAAARGLFVSAIKQIKDEVIRSQDTVIALPPQQYQPQQYQQPNITIVNNIGQMGGHTGGLGPAICSFFIPGLGQIIKGQVFNGIAWFFLVPVGYVLFIIPGLILHICCVIGAAMPSRR